MALIRSMPAVSPNTGLPLSAAERRQAEGLLRDLALVLHLTRAVKQSLMERRVPASGRISAASAGSA